MRRFSRVGGRLYEPVRIVGGPATRAIIHRPPEIDHPGAEFAYPSFTCRVQHTSLIRAGQVLRLPSGDHYLVAEHSATIDWKTFHLFRCDRQVDWQQPTPTLDPLTNLPKAAGLSEPVRLWVMWERVRREFTDLNLRVNQERHLVATGADVELGHHIEGMRVDRISHALGIKILELQG